MNVQNPEVTVLMAVRNGIPYLQMAIESILNQTYSNFKFLIVDDASTDETREVIRSYQDDRIELLCLEENLGQTGALSVGLRHATTTWIARMDADDFSAATRLEDQMEVLRANPNVKCLGAYAWAFRDDPAVVEGVITMPLSHEDICGVMVGSPIIHGTLIANREAILEAGGYNDRYRISADVDLYDRLLPMVEAANISKQLLGVRRHSNQESRSKRALDENIEISVNRLAYKNYSKTNEAVARASLSRLLLFRARHWLGRGRIPSFLGDSFSSFRAYPRIFPWNAVVVMLFHMISDKQRAKVKRGLGYLNPNIRK